VTACKSIVPRIDDYPNRGLVFNFALFTPKHLGRGPQQWPTLPCRGRRCVLAVSPCLSQRQLRNATRTPRSSDSKDRAELDAVSNKLKRLIQLRRCARTLRQPRKRSTNSRHRPLRRSNRGRRGAATKIMRRRSINSRRGWRERRLSEDARPQGDRLVCRS
jgi:hypothetical protein